MIADNPFIFGPPLRSNSRSFIFRQAELQNFYQLLSSSSSVALIGPRRSGKTTFLLTIQENPPKQYFPILIDLQGISVDSGNQIFRELTYEISNSFNFNLDTEVSTAREFIFYIEKLVKILNDESKKLMLLFDEFDSLQQKQLNTLSSTLRALQSRSYIHQNLDNSLSLVICGWPNLTDTIGSPLTNILSTYTLDNFTQSETEEALNKLQAYLPDSSNLALYQSFKERVFFWTSGQPYLVQVIGFLALQKIRDSAIHLDESIVDKMIDEVIVLSESFLNSSIEKIRDDQEAVDKLTAVLNGKPIRFSLFSQAISKLYFAGFVKENSGLCTVSSPIYEQVIVDFMLEANGSMLTTSEINRVMDRVISSIGST